MEQVYGFEHASVAAHLRVWLQSAGMTSSNSLPEHRLSKAVYDGHWNVFINTPSSVRIGRPSTRCAFDHQRRGACRRAGTGYCAACWDDFIKTPFPNAGISKQFTIALERLHPHSSFRSPVAGGMTESRHWLLCSVLE